MLYIVPFYMELCKTQFKRTKTECTTTENEKFYNELHVENKICMLSRIHE